MPNGLEVFDPSGQLRVSLTDRLGRLIDSFVVSAAASGSKFYDLAAVGAPIAAFSVPAGVSDLHSVSHSVSVSGGWVSWSPHPGTSTLTSARIASRIYVVTL